MCNDRHVLPQVASVGSGGGSGGGAGGGGKGESGNAYGFGGAQHGSVGRAEILNGWGGEGCRLAEVDGSTVAIVEVMRLLFALCPYFSFRNNLRVVANRWWKYITPKADCLG